ncbi:MAG: AraC family transcriptional regulator [Chitinophagaceae bacterium]|nr:MAG: AraC family transcriptional regulator [Chitinophagaceae bacterium]
MDFLQLQTAPFAGKPGEFTGKPFFRIGRLAAVYVECTIEPDSDERLLYYEINWFTSASSIRIDSIPVQVMENEIYFLVPGQVRSYQQAAMEGYRIVFSTDYLQLGSSHTRVAAWLDLFHPFESNAVVKADEEMELELMAIIRKMYREFANFYLMRTECLSGLLNMLLIEFSRRLGTGPDHAGSKDAELVRRFRNCLAKNFTSKKQVIHYASELCVTPNYLNRMVKKVTGFTASHHIQQHIILEAKRQALHPNSSMKEIAYLLGFDNLAHFSKFFKNNSGMNFSSFKKTALVA